MEISLSKLLPHTFILYNSPTREAWHIKGSIENSDFLNLCISEVRCAQHLGSKEGAYQWLKKFSITAINDLIRAKSLRGFERSTDALNMFQFVVTLAPLKVQVYTKGLQEGYDWITFALCDDLSESQKKEVELGRVFGFAENHALRELNCLYSVDQWIGDFYFVCLNLSAMPEIARALFDLSQDICVSSLQQGRVDEFLWSYSNLACWAANNHEKRAADIVSKMEQLIVNEETPDTIKHGLLVCLSTVVAHYSSKASHEWAQLALEQYSDLSLGHQNLQLLMESCPNGVEISNEKLRSILSEITKISYELPDPVENLRAQDRLSSILCPFIGKCLGANQGVDAVQVLKIWYGVSLDHGVENDSLLIIFPNNSDSLIYSVRDQRFALPRNIVNFYSKMIAVSNRYLGIATSVGRDPGFVLNEPDENRFGVPDEKLSEEMESYLVTFYAINEVMGYLYDHCKITSAMVALPSSQHSIQYLFQKYTGCCWPISSSLLNPAEDRKVRKVCMWCGAGSISEEIEFNAVNSVLENSGIQVDYFSSANTSKAQFISIYESDEYDVIWVMSHGEFDHWEPGNVSIEIGAEEKLSFNEILELKVPVADRRRLLFLNVCDGATYTNQGGIARLGIAPSVAGRNQCTISHMWPTKPFPAAAFGCLYASALAKGLGFFEAFQDALNRIRGTHDEVTNEIREICLDGGELEQRLSSTVIPFELMVHSGSAAFFQ